MAMMNTDHVQIELIELINDGTGLAFSIVGGKEYGIMVKTVIPNGVAAKNGRLKTGDYLLQIGDIVLNGLSCDQVAALLRTCGVRVHLIVIRSCYDTLSVQQEAQRGYSIVIPMKILDDPIDLQKYLKQNSKIWEKWDEISAKNSNILNSEIEKFSVDIIRNDQNSLGIVVAGYYCEYEDVSGIFIKDIRSDGVINQSYRNKIKINDRICQINDQPLDGVSNKEAIHLLKSCGTHLKLCLERFISGPKYDKLIEAVVKFAKKEVDFRRNMIMDSKSVETYLRDKWIEIMDLETNSFEILVIRVQNCPYFGLGVNVIVRKDTRGRCHHFIRFILAKSPLATQGTLRADDEILEANGIQLLGLGHLEVINILKHLPNAICLVCARHSTNSFCNLFGKRNHNRRTSNQSLSTIESGKENSDESIIWNHDVDVINRDLIKVIDENVCPSVIEYNSNKIKLNYTASASESVSTSSYYDECLDEYQEDQNLIQFNRFEISNNRSAETLMDLSSSPISDLSSSTFSVADEPIFISNFLKQKNFSESNLYDQLNLNSSCSYNFIDEDLTPNCIKFDWLRQRPKNVSKFPDSYSFNLRLVASQPNLSIGYHKRRTVRYKNHNNPDCLLKPKVEKCRSDLRNTKSLPEFESRKSYRQSKDIQSFGSLSRSGSNTMTILKSYSKQNSSNKNINSSISCNQFVNKYWKVEEHVIVERQPGQSLGISIVGGRVNISLNDISNSNQQDSNSISGIFIKNVIEQSPASKTAKLKAGDRILEVNGIDLRNVGHENAVLAIRQAKSPVDFLIQSWNDKYLSDETDDRALADSRLDRKNTESGDGTTFNNKFSQIQRLLSKSLSGSGRTESVEKKTNKTTTKTLEQISSPFDNSSATLDRNNNDVLTKDESILLTNTTSDNISEIVTDEVLNSTHTDEENNVDEDGDGDDDYDEYEENATSLEGRTVTSKGFEIDRASAGNVKRNQEEINADPEEEDYFGYTNNKVQKKYSWLGHTVMLVTLERGSEGTSLGLSLSGHRDRNCMAVFVCGLNPSGIAHKSGEIQVGDEILEVNGIVLHGRCHLNASAIIKSLSGPVFKIIVLRRKTAIEDLAVKPITKFPVEIEEEDEEEKYKNYPNVRSVTFRKGPAGLGIMIIEGRHADVGQGIFVSDIQEGSIAEKIGLEIGEMILSVNKETLVGVNYDTAAQTLKRSDGVLKLVLSNPKKKQPEPEDIPTSASSISLPKTPDHVAAAETPVKSIKPLDPADCEVVPGTKTTIEINSENKNLGFHVVGGPSTHIPNGLVINDVFKDGAVAKDGRLKIGDEIVEINNEIIEKAVSLRMLITAVKQKVPKTKILVYRPLAIEKIDICADLVRKSGKSLGLILRQRQSGPGVYISEIIKGGCADTDAQLMIGDQLNSINGKNVTDLDADKTCTLLRSCVGKVSLKLSRFKIQHR